MACGNRSLLPYQPVKSAMACPQQLRNLDRLDHLEPRVCREFHDAVGDLRFGRGERSALSTAWSVLYRRPMADDAYLLTRSCTTGWGDWIHGELWLLPSALVRRRLGFGETLKNLGGPTVGVPLPRIAARDLPTGQILSEHHSNKVIALNAIVHATLNRGLTSHRLGLRLADGTAHKFLWLSSDPAHDALAHALAPWLR
jgi:hypothetical protein